MNKRDPKPKINFEEIMEQRRLLRSIKPRNDLVARMIERSLKAAEAGLEPMTPEEVREYLGRE